MNRASTSSGSLQVSPNPYAGPIPEWPMLIGSDWVASEQGEWIDVLCPSLRGGVLARVPRGRRSDVERAVAEAKSAQPSWKALHFTKRQKALLDIATRLEEASETLSLLTAQDTGNAIRPQARPETEGLIALFRYFAGVAGEVKGRVLPAGDEQLQYTRLEPQGVVGAILPWNSPLMIAGMKIPAALCTGNTIVVKPAEDAPLTILKLAEIAAEVLPPGVLNVVTGFGEEAGEPLATCADVDKVSFTGSTAVGRHIAELAGSRLAETSLELGGKSPTIVFPSAATVDRLDETVEGIITGMRFTRQGQSCTAGSRLFVHESCYDEVLNLLVQRLKVLRIGDPVSDNTDMGAIINQKQYDTIIEFVDEAKQEPGVEVLLDGTRQEVEGRDGLFQAPTVLSMVKNEWRVAREEIFGPVIVAIPWSNVDEVVEMANDSAYGLAGFVWSADLNEAIGTAHRLQSGWVQVNQGGGQMVGQSYGGYKMSGIGREFSLEGALEAFTQTKQVNVKLGVGQESTD